MLTLFVGTLTDYFRAATPIDDRPPRDAFQSRVEQWRAYISDGLRQAGHLNQDLAWSEEPQEAFTHVLTVPALQALRIALVHARTGCSEPAPAKLPEDFDSHPAWREAVDSDFEELGGYDQILVPEIWLPGSTFEFTFECPYPDGHEAQAGAVPALQRQLADVERTRFPSTPGERLSWREEIPQETRDMLTLSRFAFAAFDAAVEEARTRALPLLLHW